MRMLRAEVIRNNESKEYFLYVRYRGYGFQIYLDGRIEKDYIDINKNYTFELIYANIPSDFLRDFVEIERFSAYTAKLISEKKEQLKRKIEKGIEDNIVLMGKVGDEKSLNQGKFALRV